MTARTPPRNADNDAENQGMLLFRGNSPNPGIEMSGPPYGATGLTPNVKPPKTPASDYENTKYVAISSMDVEAGDNLGIDHYDLCFVAKLASPLTQFEIDALGAQENGGRPAALDDSLNREIRGPLTGPLKAKGTESKEETHHAPLHQVDDLVERMHSGKRLYFVGSVVC